MFPCTCARDYSIVNKVNVLQVKQRAFVYLCNYLNYYIMDHILLLEPPIKLYCNTLFPANYQISEASMTQICIVCIKKIFFPSSPLSPNGFSFK